MREKTMKYVTVIPGRVVPQHIVDCLEEQPARSGFYNWLLAFKGEFQCYDQVKDRLEDYDVVQVNMSPKDMPMVGEIRRELGEDSSTKLVLNNDYVCEFWQRWGLDPWRYQQTQRMGDMVFGTEENQVSNMINGAFCLPHPTNTEVLKKVGHDFTKDEQSAGYIYHWWAPQSYLAYMTLEKVRKNLGLDKTRMYGYDSTKDEMNSWAPAMFDEVVPLLDFPKFIEHIQRNRFIYDPNPYHTYGRNGVEAACVGLPVVGSNRVFSYKKLFPELICDPMNRNKNVALMKKVMKGGEFVDDAMSFAKEEVEFFNYANSKARFKEALEKAEARGGYKWQRNQL